jgi:hypothetical protein
MMVQDAKAIGCTYCNMRQSNAKVGNFWQLAYCLDRARVCALTVPALNTIRTLLGIGASWSAGVVVYLWARKPATMLTVKRSLGRSSCFGGGGISKYCYETSYSDR